MGFCPKQDAQEIIANLCQASVPRIFAAAVFHILDRLVAPGLTNNDLCTHDLALHGCEIFVFSRDYCKAETWTPHLQNLLQEIHSNLLTLIWRYVQIQRWATKGSSTRKSTVCQCAQLHCRLNQTSRLDSQPFIQNWHMIHDSMTNNYAISIRIFIYQNNPRYLNDILTICNWHDRDTTHIHGWYAALQWDWKQSARTTLSLCRWSLYSQVEVESKMLLESAM